MAAFVNAAHRLLCRGQWAVVCPRWYPSSAVLPPGGRSATEHPSYVKELRSKIFGSFARFPVCSRASALGMGKGHTATSHRTTHTRKKVLKEKRSCHRDYIVLCVHRHVPSGDAFISGLCSSPSRDTYYVVDFDVFTSH